MQINYSTDVFASLLQFINFIDEKNTEGAGIVGEKLKLRCLNYSDWTIAFSLHEEYILIEALLHKSRITD